MPANNLHSWDLDPSAPPTRSLYPAAPPPGGATWELGDQSLRTRAEPRGGTLLQPWAPWWRPRGPGLWAAAPVLSPRLEWGGVSLPQQGALGFSFLSFFGGGTGQGSGTFLL